MYTDFDNVKQQIDEAKISDLVRMMFADELYKKKCELLCINRNVLLMDIFKTTSSGATSLGFLIDQLELLYSCTRDIDCGTCGSSTHSRRRSIDINMDEYDKKSVRSLNQLLLEYLETTQTFRSCESPNTIEFDFSNSIIIDVHLEIGIKQIALNEIPLTLELLGSGYRFFGCIEWQGSPKTVGHFVAHIRRRGDRWETYNDLTKKVNQPNLNAKVNIQLFFYVKQ